GLAPSLRGMRRLDCVPDVLAVAEAGQADLAPPCHDGVGIARVGTLLRAADVELRGAVDRGGTPGRRARMRRGIEPPRIRLGHGPRGRDSEVFAHPLAAALAARSEEHTSELQSRENLVCRL